VGVKLWQPGEVDNVTYVDNNDNSEDTDDRKDETNADTVTNSDPAEEGGTNIAGVHCCCLCCCQTMINA
jgi:hypothetical protein